MKYPVDRASTARNETFWFHSDILLFHRMPYTTLCLYQRSQQRLSLTQSGVTSWS